MTSAMLPAIAAMVSLSPPIEIAPERMSVKLLPSRNALIACGTAPLQETSNVYVLRISSRVYLKTPNAPGQRAFLRCAASFFLEIRQYSCEKMSCATQKSLAAGHIMSFQIHPRKISPFPGFILSDQRDECRKLFVECLLTIAAAPHSDP